MKQITIDCTGLDNPRVLHRTLAEQLSFPDWYGSNLDALHDLLTAITEDTRLTLLHFTTLGSFGNSFRRVMNDAELENPHFEVNFR